MLRALKEFIAAYFELMVDAVRAISNNLTLTLLGCLIVGIWAIVISSAIYYDNALLLLLGLLPFIFRIRSR